VADVQMEINVDVIRAAVRVVMEPALRLLQGDPHAWSTRPCQTCRSVSSIVGQPFGCTLYAEQKRLAKDIRA